MNRFFCTLHLMSLLLIYDLHAEDEGVDLKSLDINIDDDFSNNETSAIPVYQVVIEPVDRTKLSALVQSPVVKINKKMGESFVKGEVLIQLDDRVVKSNLEKALSALDRAKVEYEAKNQLFNENVASLFELKEAESNVATAHADVVIAQRDFDASSIEAPYDGKVVLLNISEYELPKTGSELIEIVKDDILLAKLLVPSSLLKTIKIGKKFKVNLYGEDQPVIAEIKRIGSVIDPSSDTIKIEAVIDNSQGNLRAGMTGKADLETIEKSSHIPNVKKDDFIRKKNESVRKTSSNVLKPEMRKEENHSTEDLNIQKQAQTENFD